MGNKRIIISYAGAMLAFLIGSGFATGQELMQFFVGYGRYSLGALFIAGLVLVFCCMVIMRDGCLYNLDSPQKIFRRYCGKYISWLPIIYTPLLLYSIFVVMLAGAGATFAEYWGVSPLWGRAGMAVLAGFSALIGLQRLVKIIGKIGPIIILFMLIIGFSGIAQREAPWSELFALLEIREIARVTDYWYMSGFLYASFNIMLGTGFFASLAALLPDDSTALASGFWGSAIYAGTAIVMSLSLLCQAPLVIGTDIPVLQIARSVSPALAGLFSVVLLAGIYSTAVPMLWSTVHIFSKNGSRGSRLLCIFLTFLGFIASYFPFKTLVNVLYPLAGLVGSVLVLGIVISVLRRR